MDTGICYFRKLVANFKHLNGAKDCLVIGIDIALRVVEAVFHDKGHLLATTLPSSFLSIVNCRSSPDRRSCMFAFWSGMLVPLKGAAQGA